jgi:beta-lactamase superfamily II metal-dependent hydrolase
LQIVAISKLDLMKSITLKSLKAQNGDCFLLSFPDQEGTPRNILIDGGRDASYHDQSRNEYGELKDEIDLIKERKEIIDLVILTHIDNDHICGLLKWFEMDSKAHALIKNVWFNSGKLIAEHLKKPENPDLNVGLKIFQTTETGVNEGIEFEEYLLKHKIWERKIIMKGQQFNDLGVQINVLSPDAAQLEALLGEYKNVTGDVAYTSAKEKDWHIAVKEFMEEETQIKPKYSFIQDRSVKNGSSITFILTISDIHFLFLGDSHPRGIVKALKALDYSETNPLHVAVFKVSHHGSKSNTNKELIKIVKAGAYFLSSDSSGDHHPHKRTLARIISHNPEAEFHFNYGHVKDNIFLAQDFEDFPGIKIRLTPELKF